MVDRFLSRPAAALSRDAPLRPLVGWTCVLGLDTSSQTTGNLIVSRECVLNMPPVDLLPMVERLAYSTAKNPMPAFVATVSALELVDAAIERNRCHEDVE